MHLLQSTWEAIETETKLDPKLVVIDYCNANRHRSVAKGTIMSAMLVEKGIKHGLLHLYGKDNWKHMRCGGSCSSCGEVDPATATGMAKRAFQGFKPKLEDHDTSDSGYQQRRPLSLSLGPSSTKVCGPLVFLHLHPPGTWRCITSLAGHSFLFWCYWACGTSNSRLHCRSCSRLS